MSSRARLLLLTSVAGAGFCASAILGFVVTIMNNSLPWSPEQGPREHYIAVGKSFSQGFSVGFFLCFFLTLAAYAIGVQLERSRQEPARSGPVPIRGINRRSAAQS